MRKSLQLLVLTCVALTLVGCNSYRVEDPGTGRAYYTTNIKKKKGGAIEFKDGRTGGDVTMQDSVVTKISSEEYKAAVEAAEESADE